MKYRSEGFLVAGVLGRLVANEELQREVEKDGEGEVLLLEALLKQFQPRHGLVGNEPNLAEQQHRNQFLHVWS